MHYTGADNDEKELYASDSVERNSILLTSEAMCDMTKKFGRRVEEDDDLLLSPH